MNDQSKSGEHITAYTNEVPTICGICGEPAVTYSEMAGIKVGLCESHKDGSIALAGGEPVMVYFDEKTHIANGGKK